MTTIRSRSSVEVMRATRRMFEAVDNHDAAACEAALAEGADPLAWGRVWEVCGGGTWTALMAAAQAGDVACLSVLLPVSDPLATMKDGWSAMHWAARKGCTKSIGMLMGVSDLGALTAEGLTPLMMAAYRRLESGLC